MKNQYNEHFGETITVPWDLLAVFLGNRVAHLMGNRVAHLKTNIKARAKMRDIHRL